MNKKQLVDLTVALINYNHKELRLARFGMMQMDELREYVSWLTQLDKDTFDWYSRGQINDTALMEIEQLSRRVLHRQRFFYVIENRASGDLSYSITQARESKNRKVHRYDWPSLIATVHIKGRNGLTEQNKQWYDVIADTFQALAELMREDSN